MPPFIGFKRLALARRQNKEGPGTFARRSASLVSYILPVCAFLASCRGTKSPGLMSRDVGDTTLMHTNVDAVVLAAEALSEKDKRLTLFTREKGRL